MVAFEKSGGNFRITDGSRQVFATDANLLMLLTSEQTFSATLSFPDVPKTEIYGWEWLSNNVPLTSTYGWGATGQSLVGARPQEWSNTVVLGSVPSGANIHMGRASFYRTAAPSHTWIGYPLAVLVPELVDIQIAGSFILEQAPGFCRAVSIYLDGGNLVAFLQQSVAAGAGNFDAWGDAAPAAGNTKGGENTSAAGQSIPVYWNNSSPYRKVGSGTGGLGVGPGNVTAQVNSYKNGGSNEATYSDPTNYAATYSLGVKTRFGRLNS